MGERWVEQRVPDQGGRTALVTGANSGLGFEVARVLAARGATVLLASRNAERGEAAVERIRELRPAGRVELVLLDLADLDSVRSVADAVVDRGPLDLLVNNAGVMAVPDRRTTAQGFELQMGTNHLGHFALAGLVLPALLAGTGSRVVTVSSRNHRFARDLRLDDLNSEQRYSAWDAYNRSKLANVLFALELHRRARAAGGGLVSAGAHPGFSRTELQSSGPQLAGMSAIARVLAFGTRLLGQPAAVGALPVLRAATDPAVTGGEYFGPGGLGEMRGLPRPRQYSAVGRDPRLAAELWRRSEELTGVKFDLSQR
jgi:NAD(P)-dependent dehydrogenase (short-subunit alcohol dehydrogenase family)